MPHLDDILALSAMLARSAEEDEMHLYLTDYRSLYVADVEYITGDDPRVMDAAHVPEYYAAGGLNCDCWFRLRDVRALVRSDLEGVASELARLRNTRYYDKPVSLYGGMVDLPLIVARPDNRRFFQDGERDLLADGQLWARFDAEQGGVGAMEATLRDDHLGKRAWNSLDPAARRFLAMAERTLREHRNDPAADLSPVILGYAKALEVQVNRVLADALASAEPAARLANIDGRTVDISTKQPLSLGVLARILTGEQKLSRHVERELQDGHWFTYQLAAVIDQISQLRNPAAHVGKVSREEVIRSRNVLLGVGYDSVIRRLALAAETRAL